jgi:hypothetical protein
MLTLLLFVALVFACLAVALAIAAAWMQSAFYERQVEGLIWRASLAAGIATLFLVGAAWMEGRSPGWFGPVFQFPLFDTVEFDQFWSERTNEAGKTETLFQRRTVPPGRVEYVDATGRRWQRSDSGIVTAIIVEENGERKRFAAKLAPDGTFPRDPSDPNRTLDVEYIEEGGKGRIMSETAIGQLSTARVGPFIVNLLVNLLHIILWIILFAIVMDLQWNHAVVLGLSSWAFMVLVVWNPLLNRMVEAMKTINPG